MLTEGVFTAGTAFIVSTRLRAVVSLLETRLVICGVGCKDKMDKRPKVLFSFEKWHDARHPEQGRSAHDHGVIGSLASSNMGVVSTFYYDDITPSGYYPNLGELLVQQCEMTKPNMVMASCIIQNGERNVKPEVYAYIKDELKIPVAMIWFESAPDVVRHADNYVLSVSVTIFVDTRDYWRQFTKWPGRCVSLYEPRDTALFNSTGEEQRDIPLSFLGSSFGRLDRALNLSYLWGQGLGYYKSGGFQEAVLQPNDYASLLRRSLVTLNFSSAITFRHLTGRVVEAMLCGAMLMESENDETAALFEPYRDYVPFREHFSFGAGRMSLGSTSTGDLLDKARYYAYDKPEEARRIAASGRKRAMEKCDGREFWSNVFELAG